MGADLLRRLYRLDRLRRVSRWVEGVASAFAGAGFLVGGLFLWGEVMTAVALLISATAVLLHSLALRWMSESVTRFVADNPHEGRLASYFKALKRALDAHRLWVPLHAATHCAMAWLTFYAIGIMVIGWAALGAKHQFYAIAYLLFVIIGAYFAVTEATRAERFHRRWLRGAEKAGIRIGLSLP